MWQRLARSRLDRCAVPLFSHSFRPVRRPFVRDNVQSIPIRFYSRYSDDDDFDESELQDSAVKSDGSDPDGSDAPIRSSEPFHFFDTEAGEGEPEEDERLKELLGEDPFPVDIEDIEARSLQSKTTPREVLNELNDMYEPHSDLFDNELVEMENCMNYNDDGIPIYDEYRGPEYYMLKRARGEDTTTDDDPLRDEFGKRIEPYALESASSSEKPPPPAEDSTEYEGLPKAESSDDRAKGMLPEDEEYLVNELRFKALKDLEKETDISESEDFGDCVVDSDVAAYTKRRKRKKIYEASSPVHAAAAEEMGSARTEKLDRTVKHHTIPHEDTHETWEDSEMDSEERKKRNAGRRYPFRNPAKETPEQRARRLSIPHEDLDNVTGDSEDSYSSDSVGARKFEDGYGSYRTSSDSEPFVKKKLTTDDFANKYAAKESMFWIEIVQRGRRMAKDFGLDMNFCNTTRMSGLSLLEWFGFLDKYYSEAPGLNTELGQDVTATPIESRRQFIEDRTRDARFRKPTKRSLIQLFPEFEQALKNSKIDEMGPKTDPRVIAASMKEFINSYKATNVSAANYANRSRMKPTGVQEDYLAKLLTRVANPEMKQVIQKKLYEEKPQQPNDEDYCEDLISEALAEIVKGQEFVSTPSYILPPEYRVPSLGEEVANALETETENEITHRADPDREWAADPDEKPPHVEDDRIRNPAPRRCRVCSGMNLEPMNGPFLMQLVDDVGMIYPRRQTNFCPRHQRKIRKVLARSIAMGVLDWKQGLLRYLNPFEPEAHPGEIPFPTDVRKRARNNK